MTTSNPQYITAFALAAISAATWLISKQLKNSGSLPLPPGPKRLPLLGHLFTIPLTQQWIGFHQLSKDLDSDIISFEVLGNTIVVLNTNEAVEAVLDKQSLITSDRPYVPFLRYIIAWEWAVAFQNYTERWKNHRALFYQQLGPSAVSKYWPYQVRATRRMLLSFLNKSKDVMGDLRLLSGEVVITVAYGREVTSSKHKYIRLATDAIHPLLAFALRPGAFLVNFIPILRFVPEWFPGAGFQRQGRIWRECAEKFCNIPFADVKEDIKNGTAKVSFISEALGDMETDVNVEEQEENIKQVAASMFAGGADTTMSAVSNAILTFLHHPHVVKKAQEELDRVIGLGNLPHFVDQESLPYVSAVVKECLRWREPSPMAFPHIATEELTYRGYRIPKGANIIGNIWACMHDENYFSNPEIFNPERYLTADGKLDPSAPDPETTCFGFGRRVCPGRALARNSVWMAISSLLATFNFKRVDETAGPDHPFVYDFLRVPADFNVSFEPRCKEVEQLIRESMHD
ncbi:cytochrome P450 [Panaeolus papilionaceus]|nr:cytochrome P450 [Panaeolus papilionaceus]